MKCFLLSLTCLLAAGTVAAQDCNKYFYSTPQASAEISLYNIGGLPDGKAVYKVESVKNDKGVVMANIRATLTDRTGRTVSKGSFDFKCDSTGASVDVQQYFVYMPLISYRIAAMPTGGYLRYPAVLSVGTKLPDGYVRTEATVNGKKMKLHYQIKNRKVVGKEKITTPAGTWTCCVITYDANSSLDGPGDGGSASQHGGREWFAPGFGVVKTHHLSPGGKSKEPYGTQVLTKLTK